MENRDGKGSFFWVEDTNELTPIPVKHRRKVKTKKVEFLGWGSKPLIEFLQSIGQDTGKQLSQYDVTAIINEYVHKLNLLHPMKKKKVVCDERLHSLFGKKTVPRIKIHDLLQTHFAENHESSEDDDLYNSEEYEDVNITYKSQKISSTEKRATYQKKKAPETLVSCFAAIIPENIKLLYLKRSLVQGLVKKPESFEGKLLGSYIRIKTDPNDYSQKNSHQLLPVTGVKNVPGKGDVREEVLFQVPNMIKDIPISKLSDDDFSKEECEDLCQRVKDGLLKRPTVVEFEQQAQLLHEDITKHWLPRELAYLQNLIDRANEKGWRKELFEYLERRKLLQTPSEQSKLLTEVPKVTADKLEPEVTQLEQMQDIKQSNSSLNEQSKLLTEVLKVTADKLEPKVTPLEQIQDIKHSTSSLNWQSKLLTEVPKVTADKLGPKVTSLEQIQDIKQSNNIPISIKKDVLHPCIDLETDQALLSHGSDAAEDESIILVGVNDVNAKPTENKGSVVIPFEWIETKPIPKIINSGQSQTLDLNHVATVIELSDDDEDDKTPEQENEYDFSRPKWFYRDPQGQIQGPVSGNELKLWSDAGYFLPDFKVWKDGQIPDQAVLLLDMLSGNCSK